MSQQLVIGITIEAVLILVTTFLLTQPAIFFPANSQRVSSFATAGGLVFLCFTFMWSVIFGAILSMNQIPLWVPGL